MAPRVVEQVTSNAEDQTRQPVVVLLHDVPPFTPLTAADVTVEKLRSAPSNEALYQVVLSEQNGH